jgi:digeranylgeranylglycerophospholipid reductase
LYDAIVVGAGPVGSFLAYRLAKFGYKVVVFERRPRVGDSVCCTGIIGKECFDRFPVASDAIISQATSAKFFAPSGRYLRLCKETVQAYVVDRAAFDRALASKAQEKGVDYHLSAKVEDIALAGNCVRARVESNGRADSFEGRVAIISSGFGASLPQKLGLGKISDFVLGAQAEVNIERLDEVEVYFGQEIAPGFFAWLVPTFPGKALAGLLSRRTPGSYLKNLLSNLFAQGKITSPGDIINYGGVPITTLPRTYGERVVVVGDAAGQVKPTTGGGIYYGLLCADIAAEVINDALGADDPSARRLSSYEKGWRKRLSRELQIGYWARKTYEKLSDRQIEHILDIVQRNNIHEALLKSHDFSFDWHGDSILRALKDNSLQQAVRSRARVSSPV